LKHYAARAKHINQQKAKIREEATGSGSGAPSATFRLYPGLLQSQTSPAGDDAQLADIDLQNATQRQQQALQTTANISKLMHDTAMAVIRRLQ
jgi:hypothetical protein